MTNNSIRTKSFFIACSAMAFALACSNEIHSAKTPDGGGDTQPPAQEVAFQAEGPQASDEDFPRVLEHILKWEGKCFDHPNDPGGRTYMGITASRARSLGWKQDVCKMPEKMVRDIYFTHYWKKKTHQFPWPLNLAVMNTQVNSGGGRSAQFIKRMADQKIAGDATAKALWFLQQQVDYYHYLANKRSSLKVFLKGWLNRSAYMKKAILGITNLQEELWEEGSEGFAKAVEDAGEI